MDYRTCEVHFCTIKIPKLKENEDEGSYIEHELTEKYGYNSDCYYMSSEQWQCIKKKFMPETRKQLKGGGTKLRYPTYTIIDLQTGEIVEQKIGNESMTLSEFWETQRMSNHIWEVK